MAATTIDEFVTRINQLPKEDREELVRRLNQPEIITTGRRSKANGVKQSVHPNTIWIKENKHKYPGQYVALKDGTLISVGRTLKEADLAAREKGVKKPFLHYIFPEGYIPWGGW